jgi:hypothetical protein
MNAPRGEYDSDGARVKIGTSVKFQMPLSNHLIRFGLVGSLIYHRLIPGRSCSRCGLEPIGRSPGVDRSSRSCHLVIASSSDFYGWQGATADFPIGDVCIVSVGDGFTELPLRLVNTRAGTMPSCQVNGLC